MLSIKEISKTFKKELKIYRLAIGDKRTPKIAKYLLYLAIGYALLPFDVIPDFIPVLGQLDDMIIVPALIFIALKLIPKEVMDDSRKKVEEK